ncbi:bacterial regulatory helix-turn-helix, lysR family protein [Burkholderia humptydooensis]|uniref:Transcriptional regulator, LysR family protein n=1 Tax=Burkholderia humptydooensis MSMB43 TaxID=441157 RepID=A0ABN0G9F9_9BURK|nr:bacterial regulatory helix-turn-helix, lysR family protein [Burkholderia sp. 2002721687]ALX42056.1 LysR family transcriptional regulator [Burkholderia humptydooensis]EIP88733.1 transcriptional regulator, LysR family protein [Burkholderia humptydooensis MSMB43]
MRDLNDLCYFVQVVDHGGFAPAGRALNMPKSKPSRRIALRAAAAASVGVAQLPTMMVRDPIARGELRQLLPGWAPRREIVHAVFASRRGLLPSVRAARLSRPAFRRARAGLDNARAFDRYGARLRSAPAAARDHAARLGEFP